jgi:predicted ATPase/class 3 adenylate cyclase
MPDLPSGTVTFLLTDVEESTRLWQAHTESMAALLARHDALVAGSVARHGGVLLKHRGEGDSTFAVFARATDAVAAACDLQCELAADPGLSALPVRVRAALHTGEIEPRDGDYFGTVVNLCARLRSAAHGGQTLLSRATYDLARDQIPPAVQVHEVGTFRLRHCGRARQVYQIVPEGLRADFPPLVAEPVSPSNVPVEVTDFVGRRRELAQVRRALRHFRLVTLTGIGGVGKTRLAQRVAATVCGEFHDGVWWVDLAGLDDPSLVCRTVAGTIGVREDPATTPMDAVLEWMRGKEVLLVLDSCEHLAKGCAAFVERLLRTCPDLRVLATSRHVLRLYGEHVVALSPLSIPETDASEVDAALRTDAVRLFVHRARLRHPAFAPIPREVEAIAGICRRLEGIPLSIELAAARMGLLSVSEVAEEVEDCFGVVLSADHPSLERHQSLHAAMAWSFELLTPPEQTVFRSLAVFRSWFDLPSARAVAGDQASAGDFLSLLSSLHDKSMVIVDGSGPRTYYRMLEPLRQFGEEQLREAGERDSALRRHGTCMVELAEHAEPHLRGAEQGQWLDRLDRAHDDIRSALGWTRQTGETKIGLRLGAAMWRYWYKRSLAGEGRDHLVRLLDGAESLADPAIRAKAQHAAGTLASYVGDFDQAAGLLDAALATRRELGDVAGHAASLNNLGLVRFEQGRYAEAGTLFAEGLALNRERGDVAAAVVSLGNMATAAIEDGDYERATAYAEESISLQRGLGLSSTSTVATTCLAMITIDRGEYDRGRAMWSEALAFARRAGDRPAMAGSLQRLWDVSFREGDLETSRARLEESLAISRRAGSDLIAAPTLSCMALQLLAEGRPHEAIAQYNQVIALLARAGRPSDRSETLRGLGRAYLAVGDIRSARSCLESAIGTARPARARPTVIENIEVCALLLHAEARPRDALILASAASALRRVMAAPPPSVFRDEFARVIAAAEAALGHDAAEAARHDGAGLSIEDAAAIALAGPVERSAVVTVQDLPA